MVGYASIFRSRAPTVEPVEAPVFQVSCVRVVLAWCLVLEVSLLAVALALTTSVTAIIADLVTHLARLEPSAPTGLVSVLSPKPHAVVCASIPQKIVKTAVAAATHVLLARSALLVRVSCLVLGRKRSAVGRALIRKRIAITVVDVEMPVTTEKAAPQEPVSVLLALRTVVRAVSTFPTTK